MTRINSSKFNFPIERLNKYAGELTEIESIKQLSSVCTKVAEELDVSYFSCGILCSRDFHNTDYFILSNAEEDWVKTYIAHKYQVIDPRIKECAATMLPVSWTIDSHYLQNLPNTSKAMMLDAYENGIRCGITVPFFMPLSVSGIFSLIMNADTNLGARSIKHLQSIKPYISYLGNYANQALIKILAFEKSDANDKLTSREKDCLCWLADGKTAAQTASNLFISESTVKFHCKNSMRKLGARNTAQAIVIAIFRGYIKPALGGG